MKYWKPLNWDLAVKASKLEMDVIRRVDTNRGHECRPNGHSRLVGRKVKHAKRLDLFSTR